MNKQASSPRKWVLGEWEETTRDFVEVVALKAITLLMAVAPISKGASCNLWRTKLLS